MSPYELLKTLEIMSPLEEEQSSQFKISGVSAPNSFEQGCPSLYLNHRIIFFNNILG
jgi:hypothetical protein